MSLPGSPAGGANISRSEPRGLTQYSSGRKALDGPAMRPNTSLVVENGVGKLAVSSGAPNASAGKRVWRTPTPEFVPVGPQGPAGTYFFESESGQVNSLTRWVAHVDL